MQEKALPTHEMPFGSVLFAGLTPVLGGVESRPTRAVVCAAGAAPAGSVEPTNCEQASDDAETANMYFRVTPLLLSPDDRT